MRLTVGPLPSAVYWRRRAIVLVGALVVLFLVAQACMSTTASPDGQAGGGSPDPTDSPTPVSEQTASPQATEPTGASGSPTGEPASQAPDGDGEPAFDPDDETACTDEEMRITAEAEQTSYQRGDQVQLTMLVKNRSDRSCRRDIGGGERELYLREGSGATDKVWSSRDCDGPTGSKVEELEPGFEATFWIVWQGRSSDECDDAEPAGEALEPGEYELVARLGTAYSKPVAVTVE